MISSYKTVCYGLIIVFLQQFLLIVCKSFTFQKAGAEGSIIHIYYTFDIFY